MTFDPFYNKCPKCSAVAGANQACFSTPEPMCIEVSCRHSTSDLPDLLLRRLGLLRRLRGLRLGRVLPRAVPRRHHGRCRLALLHSLERFLEHRSVLERIVLERLVD